MPAEGKKPWNHRLRQALWELGFLPGEPADVRGPGPAMKSNLPFCLSGLCFFMLYWRTGLADELAWYGMAAALILLSAICPGLHRGIRLPLGWKLFSGLSSIGAMGAAARTAITWYAAGAGTAELAGCLGLSPAFTAAGLSLALGLAGFWFLYVLIARVYAMLGGVCRSLFRGTCRKERAVLAVFVLALAVYSAMAFSHSQAFYGTEHHYDVLYTADSPYLVIGNTWLNLTFQENDLRQPLFAVFSAPFMGWAYVLTQFFPGRAWLRAWLMDLPQLVLLVGGYYMLARLLCPDNGRGRLAVTASLCVMYASLLFAVMMEQYILSVFWLLLCVYMAAERLPGRGAALMGAAGSLLTSAALLPALWERDVPGSGRRALRQSLAAVLLGGFLVLLFRRLDVLVNLADGMEHISSFTGGSLTLAQRAMQYVSFVLGCFVPPAAGVDLVTAGHPSWQLLPVESLSVPGLILLGLCALGAAAGRRERPVRISAWWCVFSLLLLLGLGWGTAENGLILYGLYFGWAFYVLLRRFMAWALERLGAKGGQTAADSLLAAALLALNIPGLGELLRFAAAYYPL